MRFKSSIIALILITGLASNARTFINGAIDYAGSFSNVNGIAYLSKDLTLFDQSNSRYVMLTKTISAKDFRIYITDIDFNIIKVFRIDQFYLNSSLVINNFFLYPAASQENADDRLILDTNLGMISIDLDLLKAKQYILQSGFFDTNFGNLESIPRIELNKASVIKLPGT
jgi:hypothetical protein